MAYDFSTVVSRKGQGSTKWAGMYKACPEVPDDIVPLSVADMELANPPEIAEGLASFLTEAVLGYSKPTESYLDAVVSWMGRRHEWEIRPEWIVDYPGVVPALFHLARALAEPGEGIILLTPVYYPFYDAIRESGRRLVDCPLVREGERYEMDFEAIERAAADPANTVLFLCSPHNPVGRVWLRSELERVADICLRNGVTVVSDEIHADLVLPGHAHVPFASLSEEVAQASIVCTAPSKTFNLAGLMTSNLIIANDELRERVRAFRTSQAVYSCNILGYRACEIAYTRCEGWLDELIDLLDGNRRLVESFIERHIPQIRVGELEGTYLMWLDCRGLGMDAEELERFMTRDALLFCDEGYLFGEAGRGFERINIACPSRVLEDALERLLAALRRRGVV